jgi:hypothetical protein
MGYEPTKDGREQGRSQLVQGLGQQHWVDWSKGEGFAGAAALLEVVPACCCAESEYLAQGSEYETIICELYAQHLHTHH